MSQTIAAEPMGAAIGATPARVAGTIVPVLCAVSFAHLVNDMLQSVLPAIYPVLKLRFGLAFAQVGVISLVYQLTASVLQPMIGVFTDRRPMPYSLPVGMGSTLLGLLLLSSAGSYPALLVAVAFIGIGSSVFHPESSRVARMASGGRHGLAQSVFQVGGNTGAALGPLMAAFIVAPADVHTSGQGRVAWFGLAAVAGIVVLTFVGRWYQHRAVARAPRGSAAHVSPVKNVGVVIALLMGLMVSKFFYMTSMSNYYTFYLMAQFHQSPHAAQLCLFVFLASVAVGTLAGGPVGDRIGRKRVIWASILGVLPFTLALPYMSLTGTILMTIPIGLLLASAFPAIVVYAQEIMPGRVGTVSGLFFGLAFGLGGLGAALLGTLADHTSIQFVYKLCAFLPALGLLAAFLPENRSAVGREG